MFAPFVRSVVLLHYQANTSTEKKNLSHELARRVCEAVIEAGFVPVILDWDKRSPLPGEKGPHGVRIFNPDADSPLWKNTGTGDSEILAALIAQASLFIGVDSGPLHVAGAVRGHREQGTGNRDDGEQYLAGNSVGNALRGVPNLWDGNRTERKSDRETKGNAETLTPSLAPSLPPSVSPSPTPNAQRPTPTLAVWTGHHPLHYFCPADHVTHLVPEDHASRLRGDRSIGHAFFEKHYRHRTYRLLDDAVPALVQEMLSPGDDGLLRMHGYWVRSDNAEQDMVIVRDIAEEDSYRLAELDVPGPVVVDVGAHIGVFSRAFKNRHPAARVVAVECCPENIAALRRNVGGFATIVPAACTYEREVALLNAVYPGCVSTGGSTVISRAELERLGGDDGSSVGNALCGVPHVEDGLPGPSCQPAASLDGYWLDGRVLPTVTLEQLMAEHQLDRIDVLKLDCEGSEFSILENTTSLASIGAIVGEYHGRDRFLDLVSRRFADWQLRILRDGDPGTFWLVRPGHRAQGTGNSFAENSLTAHAAVLSLPPGEGQGEGGSPTSAATNVTDTAQPVESSSPCLPLSPSLLRELCGLSIDLARGMAVQIDRSQPCDYDDAYFEKYLAYEGTAIGNRLGRLRTALVKKHCRTVLDIGVGCGTFLKQWALAGCGCGCREATPGAQPKKPCGGCGQGTAPAAVGAPAQRPVNGYGYEINPRAVEWLQQRQLFIDPYDTIPPNIEGFTFWDSLEHLPEPAELLARMRVGMFAFVSLPIFADLARLTESKHYRPGEHFHYFTHDGFVRFMAEQGFDLLESNRAETRAGREAIGSFVFRKTRGPCLPVDWHRRALGDPLREIEPGKPLVLRVMNGIGDLCWLMALAGPLKRALNIPHLTLELQLAGDDRDNRALEFARRFTFVDEVTTARFDIHLQPVADHARLRYIANGYPSARSVSEEASASAVATKWRDSTAQGNALGNGSNDDFVALKGRDHGPQCAQPRAPYTFIVNPWLEWQGRLENFIPELESQWDVLTTGYRRDPAEIAATAGYSRAGQFLGMPRHGHIAIHLCSRRDNTLAGMNRGGRWSLADWLTLVVRLRTITDLPIFILGAKQDADYAAELMQKATRVTRLYDACGATSTTLAIEILRRSSLVVSFASGLGIAACYLGVPTVIFWNAEGHSISPHEELWFSDSFATNWAPPEMLASGLYYPAIYGRDTPDSVFAAITRMFSPPSPSPSGRGPG